MSSDIVLGTFNCHSLPRFFLILRSFPLPLFLSPLHRTPCLDALRLVLRPPLQGLRPLLQSLRPPLQRLRPPLQRQRPPLQGLRPLLQGRRPPLQVLCRLPAPLPPPPTPTPPRPP